MNSKRILLIIALSGFAVSLALFSPHFKRALESDAAPVAASPLPTYIAEEALPLPVRLKIPAIKVDAAIESVGLTKDGAVDAPSGPKNAGWFSLGAHPGEIGSAIIDGHSGWKKGPAVFDTLYKLKKGDKIYVEDETGGTIIFIVREIRKYNPKADAVEVFSSDDGQAHLNLITCTGFWNKIAKSHSQRLVVFTDKEIP